MRHQRPSSAKRGAVSFHAAGRSTLGGCGGGGVAQPAASRTTNSSDLRISPLLRRIENLVMRCMVEAVLGLALHHAARMPDLLADFRGAARFAQPARGEPLEEPRHEQDCEEGR